MLACSRSTVDRYRFFTVAFPDGPGMTDVRTAARVASRAGIDYRLLGWVVPTDRDVDLFLYRTGCMIGERRGMRGGPSYAQLDSRAPYVSGVGGVLGVGLHDMHLTTAALDGARPDGRTVVARFGWPELPRLIERADRWLSELPPLDALNIHHLFRVEMYFRCWGGPLALGYPDACCTTVYPFGQRGVIDRLMRLPAQQRSDGSVRKSLVEACWPELLRGPGEPCTAVRRCSPARLPGASYARARARRARLVALQLLGH